MDAQKGDPERDGEKMARQILVNHMGYSAAGTKHAVYQGCEEDDASVFRVVNQAGEEVLQGKALACGPVEEWNTGFYWALDCSAINTPGQYRIVLETKAGLVESAEFDIQLFLHRLRLISGLGYYFKAQRASGEWEEEDTDLPFAGEREGRVDARGGWYDATGDYGIHLSHLSHSTYYNPQQASFTAYTLLKAVHYLEESHNDQYSMVKLRLLDEAMFGADFLMHRRAPSGSFFRSIRRGHALEDTLFGSRYIAFDYHSSFDQFTGEASSADQEMVTDEYYETSMRSGGGTAIAALAAAARECYPGTEFAQQEYLQAAKTAWHFLSRNNERYTNDGKWNLVDEYCALLAVVELFRTTHEYAYLHAARQMAQRVLQRGVLEKDGLRFEVEDGVPFHHPSDEGLPVVALLAYCDIETEEETRRRVQEACEQVLRYQLALSHRGANPFNYPRFEHKDTQDGKVKSKFFFPHRSTVEPWWQGENARIASLSSAARLLSCRVADAKFAAQLVAFADDQINWVLGLNPFDSSMMEGFGRNHISYFFGSRYDFLNCPGGIVNGITSAVDNDKGIAFIKERTGEVDDNWHWAEQWLPHATWMLYALALDA